MLIFILAIVVINLATSTALFFATLDMLACLHHGQGELLLDISNLSTRLYNSTRHQSTITHQQPYKESTTPGEAVSGSSSAQTDTPASQRANDRGYDGDTEVETRSGPKDTRSMLSEVQQHHPSPNNISPQLAKVTRKVAELLAMVAVSSESRPRYNATKALLSQACGLANTRYGMQPFSTRLAYLGDSIKKMRFSHLPELARDHEALNEEQLEELRHVFSLLWHQEIFTSYFAPMTTLCEISRLLDERMQS